MNALSIESRSSSVLSKLVAVCITAVVLQACGGAEARGYSEEVAYETAIDLELDICDAQGGVPEIVDQGRYSEVMCHFETKEPVCYAICKPGSDNCPQVPCGGKG